jgi:hypothetical protein
MSIIGTTPNGVSIIACPHSGLLASVEFSVSDANASVVSPFTGQTQIQQWPGADSISGTMTLPPLTQDEADVWISFLMELRGMANCFFIGDPMKRYPRGNPGASVPVIDTPNLGINIVSSPTLCTRGWIASQPRLLLAGDYLQIGNRLHRVLNTVNSGADGTAQIDIWPSLRDVTTDGEPVLLNHPKGLFRLATNKRTWSADYTGLTHISFSIIEFR